MKLRPIEVYVNRFSAHAVLVQGAIHLGTPEYYQDMKDVLMDLEARGYKVHYEGMIPPKTLDDSVTEKEKGWLRRLSQTAGYKPLADALGLVSQKEMDYEPTWENRDLSILEYLRLVDDPEKTVHRVETYPELAAAVVKFPKFARFVRWLVVDRKLMRVVARFTRADRRANQRREQLAVASAVSSTQNVVMVWGEAHMRGLRRKLCQGDYWRDASVEKRIRGFSR